MKITNIEETGCNDILRWAIENEVNLQGEPEMINLINNETSYNITFSDINLFELFRLVQLFRNKLRIIEEKDFIKEFDNGYLESLFGGNFHMDEDDNIQVGGDVPVASLVNKSLQSLTNLAIQMSTDNDIIRLGTARMYLPMLSRRFDVSIPIDFGSFLTTMETPDDYNRIFNKDYPNTLVKEIDQDNSSILRAIFYKFVRSVTMVKYSDKYEQLLKLIKYVPLQINSSENKLYKIGRLGFRKYDSHTHSDISCSLFNRLPTDQWIQKTKQIGLLESKLNVDFAVQIPIQLMMQIENALDSNILPIRYESSIQSIIENGLAFSNFNSSNDLELDEEAEINFNNDIEAYTNRISEANQLTLNTISLLLKDDMHNDENSAFALLPSMYVTNAVFTINMEHKDLYLDTFTSDLIRPMFKEMIELGNSLAYDMSKTK